MKAFFKKKSIIYSESSIKGSCFVQVWCMYLIVKFKSSGKKSRRHVNKRAAISWLTQFLPKKKTQLCVQANSRPYVEMNACKYIFQEISSFTAILKI